MTEHTLTEYTPTQFNTAEDKTKFEKKLRTFVLDGCKEKKFTIVLYKRLSLMFGHIAHYDRGGFYHEWFSTPTSRLRWLKHVTERTIFGDPAVTWSDVEKSIKRWAIINREQIMDAMTDTNAQDREQQARARHYIATGGIRCLACGSSQLEGGSIETSAGIAWQRVTCLKCFSDWVDNYRLVNVDEFEKGDEQP